MRREDLLLKRSVLSTHWVVNSWESSRMQDLESQAPSPWGQWLPQMYQISSNSCLFRLLALSEQITCSWVRTQVLLRGPAKNWKESPHCSVCSSSRICTRMRSKKSWIFYASHWSPTREHLSWKREMSRTLLQHIEAWFQRTQLKGEYATPDKCHHCGNLATPLMTIHPTLSLARFNQILA